MCLVWETALSQSITAQPEGKFGVTQVFAGLRSRSVVSLSFRSRHPNLSTSFCLEENKQFQFEVKKIKYLTTFTSFLLFFLITEKLVWLRMKI